MVDKINPLGQAQNLPSTNKLQKPPNEPKSTVYAAVDEVVISKEALNMVQIEEAASNAREQLAGNENATLSSGDDRLNALI